MKYCLFDGGDVVGPFSAEQLLLRPGFDAHCLVCPEEHSDEESYWKEACFYPDFGFKPDAAPSAPAKPIPAAQSEKFLKEMDTVMTELSSFKVQSKAPAAPPKEAPAQPVSPLVSTPKETMPPVQPPERKISSLLMQASKEMQPPRPKEPKENFTAGKGPVPETAPQEQTLSAKLPPADKTPHEDGGAVPAQTQPTQETEVVARTISQLSPIEEYFNTIRSGDLGNILGMPDPKENSDMNLARALESQFEKTDPGPGTPMLEEDPFDEFTPKSQPEKIEEAFAVSPDEADRQTQAQLKASLPDLQSARALPVAGQTAATAEPPAGKTEPPTQREWVVPEQEDDPNDRTVKTILEGKLKVDTSRREIPEPIKEVPAEEAKPQPATPTQQEAAEEFLKQRVVRRPPGSRLKYVGLFLGVLVLGTGFWLNWSRAAVPPLEETDPAAAAPADPVEDTTPSARQIIQTVQSPLPQDPLERAKYLVQNYPLDENRGTVEHYLAQRYSRELANGYGALWSAEPLHRDVYVVKYRLAKTRKEPIVYIFQVDTAKKKLTGALNNITLDLVGKIK